MNFLRHSKSAFTLQTSLDLVDPLLAGSQRRNAGMHRVVSEHKVVRVRGRRAENEGRIGLRMDIQSIIRRLEDGKLTRFHTIRGKDLAGTPAA